MKTIPTILFILLFQYCLCQAPHVCEAVYELNIPYKPASLQLLKDSTPLSKPAHVNNAGKFSYTNIPPGHYEIRISGRGQQTQVVDNIVVNSGERLVLNLNVYGPCLYDHPAGYIPVCPMNHRDSIIPIVYGLVINAPFVKNKKDLKVKYAGCLVTDCDPQFYCKQHDIEF